MTEDIWSSVLTEYTTGIEFVAEEKWAIIF